MAQGAWLWPKITTLVRGSKFSRNVCRARCAEARSGAGPAHFSSSVWCCHKLMENLDLNPLHRGGDARGRPRSRESTLPRTGARSDPAQLVQHVAAPSLPRAGSYRRPLTHLPGAGRKKRACPKRLLICMDQGCRGGNCGRPRVPQAARSQYLLRTPRSRHAPRHFEGEVSGTLAGGRQAWSLQA